MSATEFSRYVMHNWGRNRGTNDVTQPANQNLPDSTPLGVVEYVRGLERDLAELKGRFIMATGFGGELGEALEHLKKNVRDGKPVGEDFLLECGDVLHYLTRNLGEHGFTLQQCIDANVAKLDKRFGHRK